MSLKTFIGDDSNGDAVELDLIQLQHLLIVGTTGAGKSVCLRAIMSGLMKDHTPDDLKFVVYDEKCVEFAHVKDSPYWFEPVITEQTEFRKTLEKMKLIVEERYQIFRQLGVEDFDSYIALKDNGQSKGLPRIVLVADECAGFLHDGGEDAERILSFLLSEGQLTGIHLILATARTGDGGIPVGVLERMSSRIVFRMPSREDSIRLANQGGAEELKGKGEFMFLKSGICLTMQ